MNAAIKFRLLLLVVAVALMGALIVVVVLALDRNAREGRAQLAGLDSESFRIAELFKDRLREVNRDARPGRHREPSLRDLRDRVLKGGQ